MADNIAPPAGDPPAGDPPAGDPPAGDPPAVNWLEGLDQDVRGFVESKGYSDDTMQQDLAKGYYNLTRLHTNDPTIISLPGEDADEAAMGDFYNRLGRPSEPAGYAPEFAKGVQVDDGTYDVIIYAEGIDDNAGAGYTFTTSSDVTAPIISNVASDNITAAVVRIDNPSPGPISRRHHGKMTVAEEPARLFPVEDRFIQRVYYGTEPKPRSRGRFRPSGRIAMAAAGLGIVVAAFWYGVMRPDSPQRNLVSQRPDNDVGTVTGDSLKARSAASVSNPAASPTLPGLRNSSAQSAQAGGPTFGASRKPTTSSSPRSDSASSLNRPGQAKAHEKSVPAAVSSPAKSDTSMPASSKPVENLGRARTSTVLGGNRPAIREPQTINLGEDTLVVSSPSSLTPRTGGRIFLPGLNSPRYEGTLIYANDGLIGPVRELAEPGFTLRPGIYTITIKDSTGRVLHERANVVLSKGDVKPLELNKPR